MKRLVAVLAVAVMGIGLWAGLVSASGASVPAGERFVSKTTHSHYVDNAPKDLSAGDVLTQHSLWYQNGKKVGTMELVATVTLRASESTGQILYNGSVKLADGQIALAGKLLILPQNQTFSAAITGGTQAYRAARGSVLFHQVSGNKTIVTLHLEP